MKSVQPRFIIIISSIALFIVLVIQVNWMLQSAKMKEEIFNEKAKIVLGKTAEKLSADKLKFDNYKISGNSSDTRRIDSILNYYMKLYNIRIDYFFEMKPVASPTISTVSNYSGKTEPASYTECIGDSSSNNLTELKLVFPKPEEYIKAELKTPFISSIMLIVMVLIISWRTITSLENEKRISVHTTDYLNNMTHEFKTPITNIGLAGKMITMETNIRDEEKIKHYSGIILQENEKLHRQVEQVLGMTALERGEIPLQKKPAEMHDVIHNSIKHMALQFESRNSDVEYHLDAANDVVMTDYAHMTGALSNLLDNAIKYSKGQPRIIIQTVNNDNNFILSITDNGIGIHKKYHGKIFNKYFRVTDGNIHNVKGFGLGLSYVKQIVELHGGTITMQSRINSGTTFTITLPNA
jgi:two-component system phosphate regulon sensor histidine kinase PhoR